MARGGGGSRGRIRGVSTHLGDDNSFFLEFVCVIKVKIKRGIQMTFIHGKKRVNSHFTTNKMAISCLENTTIDFRILVLWFKRCAKFRVYVLTSQALFEFEERMTWL